MLSNYLKKYRAENGLTQEALAQRLSISQNAVSQYEKGRRMPPISKMAGIAEKLGCSIYDIISCESTMGQKEG